jgi:hypothetical protein
LADGDGVVIGVEIYPDFDNLSLSNPIYDVVSGTSRGGHAVTLIGYCDDKKAFKFINSWGTAWGLGGYGWISYDLMNDTRVNFHGVMVGFVMENPIVYEDPYTYSVFNGKATITRYLGSGGDIIIPDTLDGYPVTAIGYGAFQGRTSLTGVTIPDSVTRHNLWQRRDCDSSFRFYELHIADRRNYPGQCNIHWLWGVFRVYGIDRHYSQWKQPELCGY